MIQAEDTNPQQRDIALETDSGDGFVFRVVRSVR